MPTRPDGRFGETDDFSLPDHDEIRHGGFGYVMVIFLPQNMLLDLWLKAGVIDLTSV